MLGDPNFQKISHFQAGTVAEGCNHILTAFMISVTSHEFKPAGVKLPDIGQKGLQKIRLAKSCKVLDLCCGLGGLSLAGQNLGMEIVAGVDLNAAALRTFEKNFPQAEALEGSVRSSKILKRCSSLLKPSGGNSSSIIVSGPPCQGFSVAGSRDPVDPRNQILTAVARAIVLMQPDCALIENVSMVLADDHGKRLGQLERTLAEGGYFVLRTLLNAADYGVAQRRKRAFFLISRIPFDSVEVDARLTNLKQPLITSKAALHGLPVPDNRPDDYDDEREYKGVPNHFSMCHSNRVKKKIAAIEPGKGPMSYRRLHPDRPANTLFSGHRAPPAHFSEARSITPREAARLQGFPDSFRIYGSYGRQMEQVTNAVPPPLAEKVLGLLIELAGLEGARSPDLNTTDSLAEPFSRKKLGVSGSLVGMSR